MTLHTHDLTLFVRSTVYQMHHLLLLNQYSAFPVIYKLCIICLQQIKHAWQNSKSFWQNAKQLTRLNPMACVSIQHHFTVPFHCNWNINVYIFIYRMVGGWDFWRQPTPTPAQAGQPRAGCPGASPGGFWTSLNISEQGKLIIKHY